MRSAPSSAWHCLAPARRSPTGRLIAAAPLLGYGLAWLSHLAVEHNTPETFKHPFFSLISDLRMVALMLTGRLRRELEKHGIDY